MLMSAIFDHYSRSDLEKMILNKTDEILHLEKLLVTCGEELYKLGSDNSELLDAIESNYRDKWNYPKGYSVGTFNQMRTYIAELEGIVGKEEALKIRSNKQKYLSDWFDATEPRNGQ